jgi:hypothetical protein
MYRSMIIFPLLLATIVNPAQAQPTTPLTPIENTEPSPDINAVAPPTDPNPTGFGLIETAFMPQAGTFSWTAIDIGLQHFEYAVHDNITLTVNTVLPTGVLAGTAGIRVGGEVAQNLHLSFTAGGGGMTFFWDGEFSGGLIGFGGGPVLTYGTPDLYFNAKARVYRLVGTGGWDDVAGFALPSIGGGVRVSKFMRLFVEGGAGYYWDDWDVWHGSWIGFVHYGAHFHGTHIYGDVGFVRPIYTGSNFLKSIPLGIPSLTLGYSW